MRRVRNVGQPRAETTVYDKPRPRPVFVINRGLGGEFSTARDAVFKAARFTAAKLQSYPRLLPRRVSRRLKAAPGNQTPRHGWTGGEDVRLGEEVSVEPFDVSAI